MPTIYVLSKNKKNVKFYAENFQFLKLNKSLFFALVSFRNVNPACLSTGHSSESWLSGSIL